MNIKHLLAIISIGVLGFFGTQGNTPEQMVGGVTRTVIGTQTKWLTDLIPSASYSVNLGSSTYPVNQIFGTRASLSFGEFTGYASASSFIGPLTGNASTATALASDPSDCGVGEFANAIAASGNLTCATPVVTAAKAFGWLDMNNSGGTFVSIGSLSFDASHFTFSNTASLGYLRLDWGAGGPASLSEAETIGADWVNTANPWADNEVADILTLTGSTITGGNNVRDTLTTTANLTIGDNGDSIIIDASNWDVSTLGRAVFLTASSSSGGEFGTYASASLFMGSAFSGNPDCNDAGENIQWSAGLFTCATGYYHSGGTDVALADGGTGTTLTDPNDDRFFAWDDSAGATVLMDISSGKLTTTATPYLTITSNSLGFGEILASASLDTATEFLASTFGFKINLDSTGDFVIEDNGTPFFTFHDTGTASLSGSFEITGYASASGYFGEQILWQASIASTSNNWGAGRIPLPRKLGYTYVITQVFCAVDTATSVVINVSNKTGTYDTETVTCDVDGASDTTIGTNPSYTGFITASSSLEIGTVTGAVDWLDFIIYGKLIKR